MADNPNPVCLYIIVRTDLASLNAGKAIAQGTHAANQMVFEANKKYVEDQAKHEDLKAMLTEWESETPQGFGTCYVLGATEQQMRFKIMVANLQGLHANVTHDPTYPLLDGKPNPFAVVHAIPLDTCAYIFARKDQVRALLSDLDLHP